MSDWKEALNKTLNKWDKRFIITSPDVDGLLSSAILQEKYDSKVIGCYTTKHLLLFDGQKISDAVNALWLDHDISHPSILCIGQHLTLTKKSDKLPRRNSASFNPNVHYKQSFEDSFKGTRGRGRDKYPFGTCHLLLHLMEGTHLNKLEIAMLAHADGTFANMCSYEENCNIWRDLMFMDNQKFNDIQGYVKNVKNNCGDISDTLGYHRKFIKELIAAGIRKPSSQTTKRALPEKFDGMTGHQAISYTIEFFWQCSSCTLWKALI